MQDAQDTASITLDSLGPSTLSDTKKTDAGNDYFFPTLMSIL